MKRNKIRVVVIGAGNMGRNHLRTYSKMRGVELVALVDSNVEAEKIAYEYKIKYFKDHRTLLKNEVFDAASVVVPTHLHKEVALDIIEAGKHCLVEKPIASNPKEADILINAAKRYKAIFTVGHVERYNPMIVKIKKMIEKKEIGEITSIVVKRVGGFPRVEPKTDVIIDLAVHDIEILNFLLGQKPQNIYGHASKTLHSSKIDSAELLLTYKNASGFIQANWITPVKIRTISVTGSTGYVEGNYITQELTYYKHNIREVKNGFNTFVGKFGNPKTRTIKAKQEEPLRNELFEFIRAINTGDSSKLVKPSSAKEALNIALIAIENYGRKDD